MDKIISNLKKNIKTKIDKIGIASYDKSSYISLKRISRNMRAFWYYDDFIDFYNKNNFEIINSLDKEITNGLVIVLLNNNLFDIINNKNEINDFIFKRIGSDLNISSIILIKRCHNNKYLENSTLEKYISDLDTLIEKYKWEPLKKIYNDNSGNNKWTGHYAINTSSGVQKGKIIGNIQLANNISDYCSKEMCHIIKYQMVYYMLLTNNSEKLFIDENKNNVSMYKKIFKEYCKKHNLEINDYTEDDKLICGISFKPILYSDFETDDIQVCHLEPVTKYKIQYNDRYKLITSNFYKNMCWGFKTANMTQLDNSIEDTVKFTYQMTINYLKKDLKTSKDSEKIKHIEQALHYLNLISN